MASLHRLPFPRAIFVELMQTATSSVEFSVNNIMHREIDGVAMGSPLDPSLVNIFVDYYKALLFKRVNKSLMCYYRYVNDAFAAFNDEDECDEFLSHLNSLHLSLHFTFEKQCNAFPFHDVLVEKNHHKFVTSIYRKPAFTG